MTEKGEMFNVGQTLSDSKPWESPLIYAGIERAEDRDAYVVHFSLRCHMVLDGPTARVASSKGNARFFTDWWRVAEGFARPPGDEK